MKNSTAFLLVLLFVSCGNKKQSVDILFFNGIVYTIDSLNSKVEAFVVKDGIILETGSTSDLRNKYRTDKETDLHGAFVYPGFTDAHCHFLGMGKGLSELDLRGSTSWEETVMKAYAFSLQLPDTNAWLIGRGWDQNLWQNKEYPTRKNLLDSLFPNRPVVLKRVDGHAAICNAKALELAGITFLTFVEGGEVVNQIESDVLPGFVMFGMPVPTGMLIDNAVDLITSVIPAPTHDQKVTYLLAAQKECLQYGLTTIADAGMSLQDVRIIDSLQTSGVLKINVYAMLNPNAEELEFAHNNGIYQTERLHVRSFKLYADGALGSRGAMLKASYCDRNNHFGLFVTSPSVADSLCGLIYNAGFQVNTHCIGDSANKVLLSIYGKYLGGKNDKRWRIEHAQVVDPEDFKLFGAYSVIPSVQPTHATSDMGWAEHRLCNHRMKGAYAYSTLLQHAGILALGTDFPVESVNPMGTFYAAITRQDQQQKPEQGFMPEQKLTRLQAIKGMTVWAAYANFEDNEKGSIEKGKYADFIIFDKDLFTVKTADLLSLKPKQTYIRAELVFDRQ